MKVNLAVFLIIIFLAGCTSVAKDVETAKESEAIRAQGYRRVPMYTWGPAGERRENPNYEFWIKENREDARLVHLCLVPKVEGSSYHWSATIYINDKEAWSYRSQELSGSPDIRQKADCIVSRPLPEGRLSYHVNFRYRE